MSDNSKSASGEAARLIAVDVVAADEPPRSSSRIEEREGGATAAFASDVRVGLAGPAKVVALAVFGLVLHARQHLKVVWTVVQLVAVAVVDYLAATKRPAEHLGRDKAVLVDVSARVGHGVVGSAYEHVAARRDRPSTLPAMVLRSWLSTCHSSSVANRVELL